MDFFNHSLYLEDRRDLVGRILMGITGGSLQGLQYLGYKYAC